MAIVQYDVVFEVQGLRKTVNVKIPSVNDNEDKTRAVTAAAMALDAEGTKIWSLIGCAKSTS